MLSGSAGPTLHFWNCCTDCPKRLRSGSKRDRASLWRRRSKKLSHPEWSRHFCESSFQSTRLEPRRGSDLACHPRTYAIRNFIHSLKGSAAKIFVNHGGGKRISGAYGISNFYSKALVRVRGFGACRIEKIPYSRTAWCRPLRERSEAHIVGLARYFFHDPGPPEKVPGYGFA